MVKARGTKRGGVDDSGVKETLSCWRFCPDEDCGGMTLPVDYSYLCNV